MLSDSRNPCLKAACSGDFSNTVAGRCRRACCGAAFEEDQNVRFPRFEESLEHIPRHSGKGGCVGIRSTLSASFLQALIIDFNHEDLRDWRAWSATS